ncbi:hypothetical protein IW262DRAFT_1459842 [Armillaria fumosa]|nr:hypothetical protein IW262DRAFT_1459842 [Armillaria fumosa]
MSEIAPIDHVSNDTPSGTWVALSTQEGGDIVAYGYICAVQPSSLLGIRVQVPTKSWLVIEVDTILQPSAALPLHQIPDTKTGHISWTKAGCCTLAEIKAASISSSHMIEKELRTLMNESQPTPDPMSFVDNTVAGSDMDHELESDAHSDINSEEENSNDDIIEIQMLEEHQGKKHQNFPTDGDTEGLFDFDEFLKNLNKVINDPPDFEHEYQCIKKDIFHTFHMIVVPINHGLRPVFLHALRDHLMRWDPPHFIAAHCPCHVPSSTVLVCSLKYVFDIFGNAKDAKTGAPLFNKNAWSKANAVLELAQEGYLSDIDGVVLYEKSGVDQYGLQKWVCLHGTNKVEGGPHGDIYRKFGALHAGPWLTVNCLTDHHTWYNLQAYAKHLFGIDWTYHHDLALINRTSFLLNYMSDFISGAQSYAQWINGDLYERTEETFGICAFPGSLQLQLEMSPYQPNSDTSIKLNKNNEWLRQRQGLALPVLPSTTLEAQKYFFTNIREYLVVSSRDGKTADGKSHFYITTEILASYSKAWAKANNIHASQEVISNQLKDITCSTDVFAAPHLPFPEFLSGNSSHTYPQAGVIELDNSSSLVVPPSLSVNLLVSLVVPEVQPFTSSEPLNTLSASILGLDIAPSSPMDIDSNHIPPRVDDNSQPELYSDM